MNTIEAFGMVLRKYRLEAKLTQEQLAFACGLDRTYIGLLERSQRQPTISVVFKIAEVIGVAPHKIILEIEELLE